MFTANGDAGVGMFSSQLTLPYQAFQTAHKGVGIGAARINTHLRCGSVLPVTLRFGFFQDISGDGKVDDDDCRIFTRRQYPLADWLYRAGLVFKIGNDYTSYKGQADVKQRISFNETLDYVAALAHLSDNMTSIIHLVGWQGSGHDTLYPSLNRLNPALGTAEDLQRLFDRAYAEYNTFISYHANTDEAYLNFTALNATALDPAAGHPIPGTDDGRPNPDADPAILSTTPAGNPWVWGANAPQRTDPFQGPSYHVSKTKDAVSGQRWRRLAAMLDTVPLAAGGGRPGSTLHSDAYRDIDVSFEGHAGDSVGGGYIAEDEEMACGCAADVRWLEARNLSLGVEGSNGMASVGGPSSPSMGLFDYYWHGSGANIGVWGRIIAGSDQGLDNDVTPTSNTNPLVGRNWEAIADKVYLQAKVNAVRLTDPELLSDGNFGSGGNTDGNWSYGGDALFRYKEGDDSVFVPVVVVDGGGDRGKQSPTSLHPSRAHLYQRSSSAAAWQNVVRQRWTLPLSWIGKKITAETITPTGRTTGPTLTINGRSLEVEMPVGRPVALSVA
eukprot:g3034.t1